MVSPLLNIRPLAKVICSWVQDCKWQRSGWSAKQTSFYDYDISRSRYETLSTYGIYAQSQSVSVPNSDCSVFLALSEHGIWISWRVSGCSHEVPSNLDSQHLPECADVQRTRRQCLWTVGSRVCFHDKRLWLRFGHFFGQRLPALFGYDASFYRCNAVFGFFWTLNRLFADIHQNHLEHCVTGLECLFAR